MEDVANAHLKDSLAMLRIAVSEGATNSVHELIGLPEPVTIESLMMRPNFRALILKSLLPFNEIDERDERTFYAYQLLGAIKDYEAACRVD